MKEVQATVENGLLIEEGGTTKLKGQEVRTLAFFREVSGSRKGLVMEINGERWDTCIDTIGILCDLGLKVTIPPAKRSFAVIENSGITHELCNSGKIVEASSVEEAVILACKLPAGTPLKKEQWGSPRIHAVHADRSDMKKPTDCSVMVVELL